MDLGVTAINLFDQPVPLHPDDLARAAFRHTLAAPPTSNIFSTMAPDQSLVLKIEVPRFVICPSASAQKRAINALKRNNFTSKWYLGKRTTAGLTAGEKTPQALDPHYSFTLARLTDPTFSELMRRVLNPGEMLIVTFRVMGEHAQSALLTAEALSDAWRIITDSMAHGLLTDLQWHTTKPMPLVELPLTLHQVPDVNGDQLGLELFGDGESEPKPEDIPTGSWAVAGFTYTDHQLCVNEQAVTLALALVSEGTPLGYTFEWQIRDYVRLHGMSRSVIQAAERLASRHGFSVMGVVSL